MNLLALLLLAQASTSVPTIEVRPSSSNVSVGERFQITLEAHGPSGTTYEFPKAISTGAVDLSLTPSGGGRAESAVYVAQIFAMGEEAQVPEIEVQYRNADGKTGSARSTPFRLNIVPTLDPKEENPTPADFAPPVPVLVSRAFWVASGLAGLLLLVGLVWLVRRIRFPRKAVDPVFTPALSPEEEALVALDRLAGGFRTVEAKAFYIQLVQILKSFLERRLGAPVLEMTSTEALAFVRSHAWTGPHAVAVRDLITSADLVKFGGSSDASNGERQIQVVRDIVGRVDRLRRAEIALQTSDQDRRKSA